jgi:hypothetical protein
MFDAHSELVNIGADSPMSTAVAIHASISSLDLIEPLGKTDELNFVDIIGDICNQKACINSISNEVDEPEHFLQPDLELQCMKFPTTIHDPENVGQQVDSATTFNHKMVLTNVNADGYVHTQLLNCKKKHI